MVTSWPVLGVIEHGANVRPTPSPAMPSPQPGTAIHARGVTRQFDGSGPAALAGVDLAVAPGELLALLGPSGSGKTTLLRIIAGLDSPTAGQILFDAEDATRLPVQARRIGFVFQHYALFRHMTVGDNIAYGLNVRPRATRPDAATIRRRVGELLDLIQLSGLGGRYPAELSGGQKQRVALARALAVDPKVLLLDEPFGALDAQVRRDLRRWLRELHDRTGHTTLFVTHDQDEALELADRVAILNKGRVEQIGSPDEIYDRPASAFVAGFVGEAARVPVTLGDDMLLIGGARLPLPATCAVRPGAGELFLRPGDLQIAAPGQPAITATIIAIRRSVTGRRAELHLPGIAARVEIDLPLAVTVERGTTLPVTIATLRLFPDESRSTP